MVSILVCGTSDLGSIPCIYLRLIFLQFIWEDILIGRKLFSKSSNAGSSPTPPGSILYF